MKPESFDSSFILYGTFFTAPFFYYLQSNNSIRENYLLLSNTIISYQTLSFPIIFHYYFSLSESLSVTPVGLWRAQAERIGNIFKSHALSTSALQHLSCFFVWDSPDLIQDFCLHLCGGWRKLNLKPSIRRFSHFLPHAKFRI